MQTIGNFVWGTLDNVSNHYYPGIDYAHEVDVTNHSLLSKISGKDKIKVNSRHHEMIIKPSDVIISGCADNVIEAIEKSDSPFLLGVQWHPEDMVEYDETSRKIFEALFRACESYHHSKNMI